MKLCEASEAGSRTEEVFLLVSLYACLAAWMWLWLGLPLPRCPFLAMTGYPCPSCGMTRALRCLLHGDLAAALAFNPLFIVAVAGACLFDVYVLLMLLFRLPRLRLEVSSRCEATLLRLGAVALVLLDWAWLCART